MFMTYGLMEKMNVWIVILLLYYTSSDLVVGEARFEMFFFFQVNYKEKCEFTSISIETPINNKEIYHE